MKTKVGRCSLCGYIKEYDEAYVGRWLSQGNSQNKTTSKARCTCGGKIYLTDAVEMR